MAKQTINLGTGPNTKDGDVIRDAFNKVNQNFNELYASSAGTPIDLSAVDQHIIPATDVTYDLGSPTNRFRELFLSGNTIDLGGSRISAAPDGTIAVPGISVLYYVADSIEDYGLTNPPVDWDEVNNGPYVPAYYPDTPVIIDQFTYFLANQSDEGSLAARAGYVPTVYTPTMALGENGYTIASIAITTPGSYDPSNAVTVGIEVVNTDNMWALPRNTDINDWNALAAAIADVDSYAGPIQAGVNMVATTSAIVRSSSVSFNDLTNVPAIPADISDLTDTTNLLGSGGSITVGNGTSASVENVTEILINGTITEIEPGLVGVTISGGTTQPYLELTDTPFITQPAVLDTPVTVTAASRGFNAELTVVIGEGPVIDSITVTSAGTGYVVGQRYRINYWQVGGNNDNGNIDFTVATVGAGGTLLTVDNAAFAGLATNIAGTYNNIGPDYRPSVFDAVDTGLTLTRGEYGGLFNAVSEFSYNSSVSPTGTLWNSEGWGDLLRLGTRDYNTFDSLNFNNLTTLELVMWDTVNDKHYKFDFTQWDNDNGSYAYTRTLVTDPNYFKKDDNATANNVDVIEDDSTLQIGITRDNNNGIYNPFTEEGWDQNVSPQGTLWNIDGWNDLTDVETRTYTNFYAAYGSGQLGNRVPGSKAVMYVPSIEKYYAIEWLGWTQNNAGGGFSYTRREIDLTKLNEGITFADGTVQTTAYVGTNVVSTAPGLRRIETASGYKQVSVTERVTSNYTGAVSQTTNGYELRVARTPELDAIILPIDQDSVNATFTLSYDNITYRAVWLSAIQQTEYWFYYEVDNGQTTPQTQGDAVYLTVTTGADPVVWWNKADLPSGSADFRGAVIDYHAYTGDSTIIGSIHIVDDDGEEHISHQEVQSGSPDGENDDLWLVTSEGQIRYRRIDGESSTLKIHWTAKVFYGSELYD